MADFNGTLSKSDTNNTGTVRVVFSRCPNFANFSDSSNFSSDSSSYVEFVCYPLLLLFCTIGNGLSLIVFGSRRYASSVTVYLFVLALADLGVL